MNKRPFDLEKLQNDLNERMRTELKKACDFYLRYYNSPEDLLEEHKTWGKKRVMLTVEFDDGREETKRTSFKKAVKVMQDMDYEKLLENLGEYNLWLFKTIFEQLLGDEE